MFELFSHTGQRSIPLRSLIAKWPHSGFPHTYWIVPSDSSRRRSLITIAAPWPIRQSRSISPNRSPPWRERPVLVLGDPPDDALLPVAGRELVPELGDPEVAHLHLRELRAVLALREHHGVHPAALSVADRDRRLPPLLGREEVGLLLEEPGRARLPDEHFAAKDEDLRGDQ